MQKKLVLAACVSFVVLTLSACSSMQAVPEKDAAPGLDGSLVVEGPPAANSLGQRADEIAYWAGRRMRNTPRGKRAAADADMNKFKALVGRFSETTGVAITPENTPDSGSNAAHSAPAMAARRAENEAARSMNCRAASANSPGVTEAKGARL